MEIKDLSGLGAYSPIIHELYKDMVQPAARNVGLALGAVTSIGLFLHLLTSWGTERLNICLKNNLEQYADKLKDVPEEQIIQAPSEIALPIIEKLSYVSNEELRDLYIELLTKASIKDMNDKAHPSFVNIINNLSPDEAILLKILSSINNIHSSSFDNNPLHRTRTFEKSFRGKEEFEKIVFPQNLRAYLENFVSLGLISIVDDNSSQVDNLKKIEKYIRNTARYPERYNSLPPTNILSYQMSLFTTEYGKLFLKSIFPDGTIIEEEEEPDNSPIFRKL
ncbi:TPA: DUF4393 domain-containing protein [Acinetobacter baumannii]|nr:DUF4393 domain-containing protein [Acinetobacter baumannii]HCJ7502187.1 DUF4393 domain-containing protein [Acinetobacter baumannii]HCJ7898956.1 DUF4393 domain-containing protein [Acinetobacter baumannii]